ncbi:MAG TPA: hypothetical protein VGK73_04480 [Polyangiaceae bacterium]
MDGPADPALPLLEKFGLAVLRRTRARAAVSGPDDPIHVLNADELRELRRIERKAVLRAGLAGALSGAASAGAAIWAHRFIGPDGAPLSAADGAKFWAVVVAVTIVASILEIGFLYWDALRTVHELASAAGLELSEREPSGERRDVALALARAALELPNPVHRTYGIDPRRESVRWVVALAALLYKAKIAVTTFLVKLALRSLLGRVMTRALFELAAVPVTAVWNAIVCFVVVREARLRTMGPSAASQLVGEALADSRPTPAGRAAAFRSVASAIVRTQDFHPNHLALVRVLVERLGPIDFEAVDDSALFLRELGALGPADQTFALDLLVVAAVLDGRLKRAEKRLLVEAFGACGRPLEFARIERLRRAFQSGKGIDFSLVREATRSRA